MKDRDSYYSGYDGSRPRSASRRNPLMLCVDMLRTRATAVVSVALALTLLVPYVDPARIWFFPLLGLAAPAIYVAGFMLMLYWIIRWRRWRAVTMAVLVLLGLFKVPLFWRPEFRRDYGVESYERNVFKVMTFNVRNFYGEAGQSSVGDVVRLIGEVNPDIVCLQEFNARLADKNEAFAELEERYESVRFNRRPVSYTHLTLPKILRV